jgi:hypothetical protein
VHALDCRNQLDEVDVYLESDSYRIFVASPEVLREYADYDSQLLSVTNKIKRTATGQEWVYFHKDLELGYACTNNPPELGVEAVYVVYDPADRIGELHTVVQVFELETPGAEKLLANDDVDSAVLKSPSFAYKFVVAAEIKRLMTTIRMKFDEFRYWSSLETD